MPVIAKTPINELKLSVSAVCQTPIDPELSITNNMSALVTSSCSYSSIKFSAKSPSAIWSARSTGVTGSLEIISIKPASVNSS